MRHLHSVILQYLLPVYLLVSPFSTRSATLFLVIAALATLPLLPWRSMPALRLPRPGLYLLSLPFALWFALSPFWAEAPGMAAMRVASIAGLVALAIAAIAPLRDRRLNLRLPIPALAVVVLAAALLLIILRHPELASEQSASNFNRSAISFSTVYWLIMCRLWVHEAIKERNILLVALLACAAAVLFSDTQSAVLGLIAGQVAMVLALAAPRLAFWTLSTTTILLMLFIRPVVGLLSHPALAPFFQSSFMVHGSGSIRLNLWREYLAMADDRFWLGYGPGTAHALDIKQRLVAQKGGGFEDFLNFIHPHNAFVQVWFDLGVIGALLAVLVLVGLFARLHKPLVTSPPLMGLTACVIAVSTVSHGLYQSWWLALVALGVVYAHAFKPNDTNGL